MKKIYYEKVGRRYVPVAEYDNDYMDSFPKGNHLVMCYPGGSSRRFNIDPNYAAMIAAGRVAEDEICRAISKASEMRPQQTPIAVKVSFNLIRLERKANISRTLEGCTSTSSRHFIATSNDLIQ